MSCIFSSHKYFANALFKEAELAFRPLYITIYIGVKIFNIEPKEYNHYIKYIKNNQAIFKTIHESLRQKQFQEQTNDHNYYEEQMKRILLAEALIERNRPLNLKTLVKTIYNRVYEFPYIANISDLYQCYLRNLPNKVFKTSFKKMPKITLTNQKKNKSRDYHGKAR